MYSYIFLETFLEYTPEKSFKINRSFCTIQINKVVVDIYFFKPRNWNKNVVQNDANWINSIIRINIYCIRQELDEDNITMSLVVSCVM